jgi:hypothetical protein
MAHKADKVLVRQRKRTARDCLESESREEVAVLQLRHICDSFERVDPWVHSLDKIASLSSPDMPKFRL